MVLKEPLYAWGLEGEEGMGTTLHVHTSKWVGPMSIRFLLEDQAPGVKRSLENTP